jgi:gamma-glutamyltranspeptidase / glutathione hydrolase
MTEGKEIVASKGVVATGPAGAARAGARLFEQGGNAFDAVAAACVACAVLEPQAVDLGGGGRFPRVPHSASGHSVR